MMLVSVTNASKSDFKRRTKFCSASELGRWSSLEMRRCTTFHLQLRQKATLLRSQEKTTSPPPKAKAASSLTVSDERSHPGAAGHTSAVSKGHPMRSMREVTVSTRTVSVNRRRDHRDKEWRREIRTVGEELCASPRNSESVTTTGSRWDQITVGVLCVRGQNGWKAGRGIWQGGTRVVKPARRGESAASAAKVPPTVELSSGGCLQARGNCEANQ
ncbi:hypothetical protein C8F04DRAFT_1180795 [Mycena alexandri]|uniref:Uncharacterized protein n=1 Tax=Mycena alexandri TaxID=1745969 RepID=A0AAD6X6A1_9AGAR|nr:hypothetical protein C8F04DRAFT_1180795 [Mycena alexandri]